MQAYESLAILEATSTMAQRALESNSKLKGNDSRNISAYFNKVCLRQSHFPCSADIHGKAGCRIPSHLCLSGKCTL